MWKGGCNGRCSELPEKDCRKITGAQAHYGRISKKRLMFKTALEPELFI